VVRAPQTSRVVRLFVARGAFPWLKPPPTTANSASACGPAATGDGRTQTRWNLVVRLNAAGEVQTIEFSQSGLPPPSPHL